MWGKMRGALILTLLIALLILTSGCITKEELTESIGTGEHVQTHTKAEKQTETPREKESITKIPAETPSKPNGKMKTIKKVSGKWKPIGPDGGDMHFVYATKDGILFVSHGFAGVWRSEDGGKSWRLIMQDGFVDIHFLDIAEHEGKLYAGTNGGLWVSEDKGRGWRKISTGIAEIDNGIYIISSLAVFNGKVFFTTVLDKKYRKRRPGYGKLYYLENGEVKEFPIPKDASAEMVIEARDPYLFLSSPYSGLYVFSLENPTWVKILDKKTTKVYVDDEYNLYVGTIGDWWYLGKREGDGWKWEHLMLPKGRDSNTIFHFLVPDPINKKRLWFGAGGISGIYSFSARGSGNAFVGVGCRDGKWYDVSIKGNFALSIAFLPGGKVSTKCGYATKFVLVPQGGGNSVMKTRDGGKTWERSYDGIWGDTINAINLITSGLWKGSIAVTAVSGTQITKDFGDSWVEGIDFTLGRIEGKLPGYHWIVISPDEKIKGKYDLLVSTGYPSPEGGDGVFGVDTSCLMKGKVCAEKLLEGPHYEMVIIGDKLYAGSMEKGVDVLDLKTFKVSKISLPGAGVLVRYFDGKLFIGTYEEERFIGDMWRFLGKRGRVYICDGECKEIYDKYVISFFVKDGEFIALSPGSLVYKPDINSEKTIEVRLPKAEYSDMAVDWEDGLVFISTFDRETPGVLWTTLEEVKRGRVKLRPLEDGLLTRQVRNLVYFSGYLFAGTEGQSVWRIRVEEAQSPKEGK